MRQGNHEAFNKLYDAYAKSIYLKLKRLVLLPQIAEELHQDIFLAIWDERETLPVDIPFQSIINRKATNITIDFYRKAARDFRLREQLILTSTKQHDELLEHLAFKETNAILMTVISRLPEQRKKIFIRVKLDGKSYGEVADEFGVSLSTIKDHMTRALKFVRTEMTLHHPLAFLSTLLTYLLAH